ncbi:MAG: gamma-glutamyltransferase [Tissierellaceae bacterium]|nr:gamma-glutamyltransferase [Tissierellaceae bacterium]
MLKIRRTKRIWAFFLVFVMMFSTLVACTPNEPVDNPSNGSDQQIVEQPPVEHEEPKIPAKMEGDEFDNGAIGENGGVSSSSEYSSQIGIDILKAGGNAVDAAVATAFAIGLVEPNLSGIGGCGMMNVYLKDTNEYIILEYMETVPNAVEPGWFNKDTDGTTAKNAAVPSQVHGLLTALEKYGTMSREEVMAPAIKLAREGFKMDSRLAGAVADNYDFFSQPGNEYLLELYTNDGIPYSEGDLFKNEDLANSLQAISDGGIEEFYEGDLAKTIVEGLQAGGSLITMEDMANYETAIREPIKTTYHGYEVITVPPPSNGGDWLLETLNILENYDLKSMGFNSPEYLFTFGEATRLGLVDSYAFIGDPAFYNLPIDQMVSKEYAKERVALMPTDKVLEQPPAGDLPVEKLDPTGEESKHTSHIAVIDEYGNIVSTTNTLGLGWGCKFAVPGTGFFYNSHISNLEHNPEKSDSPDYVMPGKRVRSTISPTLVLKDGEPIMAIGSPGSLAIPPAIVAVLNNVLLFDMNIQQAINAPRALAIDRFGATMTIEDGRFDEATIKALEEYGYTIKGVGEYSSSVGGIAAIYLDREAGVFYAGADPRRNYKALAY